MRTSLKLVPTTAAPKRRATKPRAPTVQERVLFEPADPFPNFEEILRLTGGSAANGDKTDPVVFQGAVELQMRRFIAKYGFDRLPLTYGELRGLLHYCDGLEAASGKDILPPKEWALWQEGSLPVWERYYPDTLEAVKLYCKDNLPALLALHRKEGTLERLGREFVEFENEEFALDDELDDEG